MIESEFIKPVILFIFNSPQEWILVIAVGFLLFGAKKLPELAKSAGKTRRAFKEGMLEAEEEDRIEQGKKLAASNRQPTVLEIDDATLLEEIRRRKELSGQAKTD